MSSPARNKAEEKFAAAQRAVKQMQKDRERAQQQLTEKVARLRALRLARDDAEKKEAARLALLKAAAARR